MGRAWMHAGSLVIVLLLIGAALADIQKVRGFFADRRSPLSPAILERQHPFAAQ
jgi:hypothetical protein